MKPPVPKGPHAGQNDCPSQRQNFSIALQQPLAPSFHTAIKMNAPESLGPAITPEKKARQNAWLFTNFKLEQSLTRRGKAKLIAKLDKSDNSEGGEGRRKK